MCSGAAAGVWEKVFADLVEDLPDTVIDEVLKSMDRENRELRQANEILRKASAYFAMAELDRRAR